MKIKAMDLIDFFKQLKGNLGMLKEKDNEILRSIVKLNLER
jgi:hypothetical protein